MKTLYFIDGTELTSLEYLALLSTGQYGIDSSVSDSIRIVVLKLK
jgi:hypothetical protein